MAKLVNIAQLDRKVDLSLPTETVLANGQRKNTYASVYSCMAHLVPMGGGEVLEADQKTAINNRRYIIRYPFSIAVDATYRLVDGSANMEITNVQECYLKDKPSRQRFLELTARLTDHGN